MVNLIDLTTEGIVFIVMIVILIYAELARRKQHVYLAKKAWPYMIGGFGLFTLSGLFDFLDEFDIDSANFFDITGQIIFIVALGFLLFGLIRITHYSSMLSGNKT